MLPELDTCLRRAAALALVLGALACAAPSTAHAQRAGVEYNPFAAHRARASIGAGVSASGSETYLQLGFGVGYFLTDGLQLGVDTSLWFIGDPTFINLTPGLTYVFYMVPIFKPYVGGFYRHAFVFDFDDLDSIGARGGVYLVEDPLFIGLGLVYEHWLSCEDNRFVDCDQVYPEATLGFSF
jgi:hypothetical protein